MENIFTSERKTFPAPAIRRERREGSLGKKGKKIKRDVLKKRAPIIKGRVDKISIPEPSEGKGGKGLRHPSKVNFASGERRGAVRSSSNFKKKKKKKTRELRGD